MSPPYKKTMAVLCLESGRYSLWHIRWHYLTMRGPTWWTAFLSTKPNISCHTETNQLGTQSRASPQGSSPGSQLANKSHLLKYKKLSHFPRKIKHGSHLRCAITSHYWWMLSKSFKKKIEYACYTSTRPTYMHTCMHSWTCIHHTNTRTHLVNGLIQNSCYQTKISSFYNQATRLRTESLRGHSVTSARHESSPEILANDLEDLA